MLPSQSQVSVRSHYPNDLSYVDAGTQTVIRVQPHILESTDEYASVRSDRKSQTLVSLRSTLDTTARFISLLKFTPYQDIQEGAVKIMPIPKRPKLQFARFASTQSKPLRILSLESSLSDDDGLGYIICEVYQKIMRKDSVKYEDRGAQTDLKVKPHILLNKEVATVTTDSSSQVQFSQSACSRKK